MRSDAIFASLPTIGTMETRKILITQLGSTSLEDLQEILSAICLQEAAADNANNTDNTDNHVESPKDDP